MRCRHDRRAGSSPRSRGTPCDRVAPQRDRRFIPALAGNTRILWTATCGASVHPRARGEHDQRLLGDFTPFGSSPRSRGTQFRGFLSSCPRRFIPALAGNTLAALQRFPSRPVHPRARGEHQGQLLFGHHQAGSSPRSRGTRRHDHSRGGALRFIPALAGNTFLRIVQSGLRGVHPRARGEHLPDFCSNENESGSSPRSRGTRHDAERTAVVARFIPALAGNTPRPIATPPGWTVHPRARGEHLRSTEMVSS